MTCCAPTGEDGNDDGLPDPVCLADSQKLGATCGSTQYLVTGRLTSGTASFGQDNVKIRLSLAGQQRRRALPALLLAAIR